MERSVIRVSEKYSLRGISVSVVQGEKILLENGYGISSSNGSPVDKDTVFPLASVTKVFTSLLILKLQEEGKLKLDDPVDKYIQEFNLQTTKKPTLRDLITHRAGIPSDLFYGFTEASGKDGIPIGYRKLPEILKTSHPTYEPKTAVSYSNLGYSLLAIVIERVSGKTLEEYASEKLFIPLDMKRTSFLSVCKENCSNGYYKSKEVKIPKIRDLGAGSLSSTASDETKILKMLLNGGTYESKTIFKSATLSEMYVVQNSDSLYDGTFKIGLPYWIRREGTKTPLHTHGGDLPPFHSFFLLDIKNKIGITINTNTLSSSEILAELAENIHEILIPGGTFRVNGNETRIPLDTMGGSYVSNSQILKLIPEKKYINTNLPLLVLKKKKNDSYSPVIRLLGFLPIENEQLEKIEISGFKNSYGERYVTLQFGSVPLMTFVPYNPVSIPKAWEGRLGKYRVLNSNRSELENFSLKINEGRLEMEGTLKLFDFENPFRFILRPKSESSAVIEGYGRNSGDTVEVNLENGREILKFSGFVLQKM